jgi:hypothetical protein
LTTARGIHRGLHATHFRDTPVTNDRSTKPKRRHFVTQKGAYRIRTQGKAERGSSAVGLRRIRCFLWNSHVGIHAAEVVAEFARAVPRRSTQAAFRTTAPSNSSEREAGLDIDRDLVGDLRFRLLRPGRGASRPSRAHRPQAPPGLAKVEGDEGHGFILPVASRARCSEFRFSCARWPRGCMSATSANRLARPSPTTGSSRAWKTWAVTCSLSVATRSR